MLRMPECDYARPRSVEEALELLSRHGDRSKILAGGTDLVPNMKHRLFEPEILISLSGIEELRGLQEQEDGSLCIGAMTTLEECERSALVQALAPGLAQAARAVAGPSQRNMATLGGNVCLDTRCVWYNQTLFWRKSLGYCLKKDGSVCHVVKGGSRCVAAASNDTGTMLVALDASLEIARGSQRRRVAVRDFYHPDGTYNLKLQPDELLLAIWIPPLPQGHHSGYAKLRPRASIDFPKLSVASTYQVDDQGTMTEADVVVSALAAVPKRISGVAQLARGQRPQDPAFLQAVGDLCRQKAKPLTNIDADADWRREMVPVFTRRAFQNAVAVQARSV